jgi:hypothetical protein
MSVTTLILQILSNAAPSRLNETVLLAEARILRGGCGESEFRAALRALTSADMALPQRDELTGDTTWTITKRGEARIKGGQ